MWLTRWTKFVLSMSLVAGAMWAQEFRATLTGRVTDPTNAGVANAKVTAVNVESNETAETTTSAEGNYTIPLLKPGGYIVRVEASGFKTVIREGLQLAVSDKRTLDVPLEIGAVQDSITVSSAPPMLDEATATRGGLIENLRVTELPLSGRNPIMLANLTPGVQFNGNPQFIRPFDNGDNANFSISGGLRQANEFVIDGAPDNAVTDTAGDRSHANQNVAYIPTVDATQEFKIVTNLYDAQYGRTGGGVVNVSTKAGSNTYHGTLYEFMRRYEWDANNIAANAAGRPVYVVDPVTGQNLGGHKLDQYGLYFGGPVLFPKLYNGKDKTFFSFAWENYRESTPSPGLTSVPTLLERQGDFSQSGITIYDPLTTAVNPAYDPSRPQSVSNPQYIRNMFPNNVIPRNRMDTVGFNIANAYPAPNVGTPNQRFNNYLSSPNLSLDKFRNWLGRVDHNFGEKERLFARYSYNKREQYDQGTAVFPGIGFDAQDPLLRENHNAVFDSVTVLNPTLLLDVRVALTRYTEAAYRRHVYGFDATSIGFPAAYSNARFDPIPPRIQLEQYPTDFGTRNQRYNVSNIISLTPNLSWIRGRHSAKFGADLRDMRVNTASGSFVYGGGQFHFNRDFTTQFPGIQQNGSGSAVASLLVGAADQGVIQYTPRLAYRWPYYGFYFQDDIRITSRLTVNLGLRWDVEGSPTERYNRMNRGFSNTAAAGPLAAAAKAADPANCPACANLTGGLLFAGVGGQDRTAWNTGYDHWQPRAGAAYRLGKNTVLRGGFGIFYLPEAVFGGVAGFAADTSYVATSGGGPLQFTPANQLSNPFPGGLFQPTGSAAGLATFAGGNVIFTNPDMKVPHVQQFSFGIQHQLPWNVKLDASYVGSRTYDINTNDNQAGGARNINVNSAEQLARARQDPSYLTAAVPNPFAGLLPGTNLNGQTVPRSQLLKPYPQFNNVVFGSESVGKIWYDSLQVSAEKRYTQGLVLVLSYTFSKNLEQVAFLNPQDQAPTKVLTSNDRPHRLVLSGVWELPFGRGRWIGKGANRPLNMIIAGWEYGFIGTIQSGVPLGLPSNVDLIGDPTVSNQNFQQWFNGCVAAANGTANCANPAWRLRGPNTLQTIPFRIGSLRAPTRPTWDMSLNKRVYANERFSFQVRLEAFNVFNSPIRSNPVLDATRADFGIVPLGQANFPRQVQLGFKMNF